MWKRIIAFVGKIFGMNAQNYEETIIRAIRTFIQSALSVIVAFVATINWDAGGPSKAAVITLISTAISAGISAVMNLPKR